MSLSRLMLSAALLSGIACEAEARNNPAPRPSGVVIHLFGQDSVMSDIAPGLGETTTPAGSPPAGSPPATASQPGAPAPAQAEESPSWGRVAHQLFVVGDPQDPSRPSPGRTANRPGKSLP